MCCTAGPQSKQAADAQGGSGKPYPVPYHVKKLCGRAQFDRWFKEAVEARVAEEPNQMALASADAAGAPSVRMVLLKGYDARGFIFYTNYDSRKAAELTTGRAALSMYWEPLQRSVRAWRAPRAARVSAPVRTPRYMCGATRHAKRLIMLSVSIASSLAYPAQRVLEGEQQPFFGPLI